MSSVAAATSDRDAAYVDGGALSLDVLKFAAERAQDLASVDKLLQSQPGAALLHADGAISARNVQRLTRRRGASNVKWRWRTQKWRASSVDVHPSCRKKTN